MRDFAGIFEGRRSSLPLWYGISDRRLFPQCRPEEYVRMLVETSADIVQLREKDLDRDRIRHLTEVGMGVSRRLGKVFLINSDTETAARGGASGVHLAGGGDPARARSIAAAEGRTDLVVGLSVHSLEEARAGADAGADYVLLGPVFPPISKQGRPAIGLKLLEAACLQLSIPVIALGGITTGNAKSVLAAGAAGLAGISWVNDEIRLRLGQCGPRRLG